MLDDRPLTAGAKFADADLIGCPLRVTVSPRRLQASGGELPGRKGVNPSAIRLLKTPDLAHAQITPLMST